MWTRVYPKGEKLFEHLNWKDPIHCVFSYVVRPPLRCTSLSASKAVWSIMEVHVVQPRSVCLGSTVCCWYLNFFKRHQSQLNHLNPITIPQATIEKTLYSLIDWDDMATNSYLRSKWSSCITLLPSLGGGGTLGANHKTNWIEFCLQLIDSIHSTVNDMFRNIDELKVDKQKQAPLPAHSRWSTCR